MDLRSESEIIIAAEQRGHAVNNKSYRNITGKKIKCKLNPTIAEKAWVKRANLRLFELRVKLYKEQFGR